MAIKKETIYGMSLDVSKIRKSLKDVRGDLRDVTAQFEKGFTVKINARQMTNLRKLWQTEFKALGDSMSQSMDRASNNIVASIDKITNNFQALPGKAGAAGRAAGTSLGQGLNSGLQSSVTAAGRRLDAQLQEIVNSFNARISKLKNQKGWQALSDRKGLFLDTDNFETSYVNAKGKPTQGVDIEKKAYFDRILRQYEAQERAEERLQAKRSSGLNSVGAQLDAAHSKALSYIKAEGAAIEKSEHESLLGMKKLEDAREKKFQKDYAELEKLEARELASTAKTLAANVAADKKRHEKAMANLAEELAAAKKLFAQQIIASVQLNKQRLSAQDAAAGGGPTFGQQVAASVKLNEQRTRALIKQDKDREASARRLLGSHTNIGSSLSNAVILTAKYLVMFRLLHELARGVEMAIGGFVTKGIEYLEASETQKLALAAVLNESQKIYAVQADGTKKQLEGITAFNALQAESEKQWAQLQRSSFAVVGTTQDLMDIYVSLLPIASKLGATTGQVQQMTKSTAIAASLLKVSFQDSRTAIVALLQGRNLTRNRLAASLGIDEKEIARLKGTPELFQRVQVALQSYELAAGKSTKTFAALKETFSELVGIVGSQFTSPFMDLFKEGVTKLQGQLFDDEGNTPAKTALLFKIIQSAVRDVTEHIREFGIELTKNGDKKILTWVIGMRNAVDHVASFVTMLMNASMALVEFTSKNQSLIKTLAVAAVAISAFFQIQKWTRLLIGAVGATKAFDNALAAAIARIPGMAAQLDKTSTAATIANKAVYGLGGAIAAFGTGMLIGAAVYGITRLITKFMEMRDRASEAAAASKLALRGDVVGAMAKNANAIADPNPMVRGEALLTSADHGGSAKQDRLNQMLGGRSLKDVYQGLVDQERALDDRLQKTIGLTREKALAISEERVQIVGKKNEIKDTISVLAALGAVEEQMLDTSKELEASTPATRPFSGSARRFLAEQLRHAAARNREHASGALEGSKLIDAIDGVITTPREVEKEEEDDAAFRSKAEDRLKIMQRILDSRAAILKSQRDNELIDEAAFNDQMNAIDQARLDFEIYTINEVEKEWTAHVAKKMGMPNAKKIAISREDEDFRRGLTTRRTDVTFNQFDANQTRRNNELGRLGKVDKLVTDSTMEVNALLDGIFGRVSDKTEDQIEQMAQSIRDKFKAAGDTAAGEQIASGVEKSIPMARAIKGAQADIEKYNQVIADLQRNQQSLNEQFELGMIPLGQYTKLTQENTDAQVKNLKSKIEKLGVEILNSEHAKVDPSRIAALKSELEATELQLASLSAWAVKANAAFGALMNTLSAIQSLGSIFDGYGSGLSNVIGGLTKAVGAAGMLRDVFGSMRNMMAKMGDTNAKNFFSMFSGGIGMKQGENGMEATKTSAVLGGIGFGVGAAISIAGALFERAVKKVKDTVTKNIDGISKALSNGSLTIAEAQAAMERERAAAQAKYSKSKSGRKALKDLLPEFDQQLEDMANKIKDIRKTFEDKLADTRLGKGIFGDFARTLIDLQTTTSAYLDTFTRGTAAYAEALSKVHELFNVTLREAKQELEAQMIGFNTEALDHAIQVIELIQQQADMYEQLADLEARRQDIDEREREALADQEKDWAELAKKREDNSKKILELEKKIADVVKKAKADEDAIRRRGILEAQETVAQQKAREINQIRHAAREEIDELKKQIEDLRNENFKDEEDALTKKYLDQQKAFDKERIALEKQIARMHDQIKLADIRLETQRRIADLEGEMFDLSGDRYELERKRGEMEVAAAKVKIEQWQKVKDLIASIIDNGEGVIFNPPPGFPQIRVTIGDINITSPTYNNGGGGGGTTPPGPGDPQPGPRDPKDPSDPGYNPPPMYSRAFESYERMLIR